MLDIPSLGMSMLNNALTHLAETTEDADTYESATEIIETCRGLVGRTPLKKALSEIAENAEDYVRREKDITRECMEVLFGKGMML
jgi:hypothetical protein